MVDTSHTPKDNEKKVKTGLIFREKKDTKKSVNDVLGKNQMKYRSYFKIRTPTIGGGTMAEVEKEVLDTPLVLDPTIGPTLGPTFIPTIGPTLSPSEGPTLIPTVRPTIVLTYKLRSLI